jgi:AcrR family transcriptional regulator
MRPDRPPRAPLPAPDRPRKASRARVEPGRRERTKLRNRAELLAAARKIFAEQSYDRTTVRDIVRATRLSVGTFYEYFRDKDAIFAAVAEEVVEALRERLRRVRTDPDLPLEERLYRTHLGYFQFVIEERGLYEFIQRNLPLMGGDAQLMRTLGSVRTHLLEDIEKGELPAMQASYVAAAMVGLAAGLGRQLLLDPAPDPEAAARFCTDVIFEGILRVGRRS